MDSFSEKNIRNVIFVSHIGAGKTSLVEAINYAAGGSSRLGKVDEGNSISDYDPIEIERKISINVSLLHCAMAGTKINLIDTPGYADFIVELRNSVPAADAALVLVSAPDGLEVGTGRAWGIMDESSLPRGIFLSKLDKDNADFFSTLEAVQSTFGSNCLPVMVPNVSGPGFSVVAGLLDRKGWGSLGEEEKKQADALREKLIEQIAEVDDTMVEEYLNGQEFSVEEIDQALKLAIRQRKLVPVFCGNSLSGTGIKETIDFIIKYFPSPADRGAIPAKTHPGLEDVQVEPRGEAPFAGYVFKTISDPYVGQLSVFRVFSGNLHSNSQFQDVNQEAAERIGQIYLLQGREQIPVASVGCGDIGAVAKLKNTHTGETIADPKHPVEFSFGEIPDPAISYSLKPKTRQDEEKISQALAKMTLEDRGLKVSRDAQTHELIISGMGEMHLEVTIERLKKRYHVEVEVGTPKVAYKETIRKPTKIHNKYKKQSGGRGQYGDVWLEIEPLERGGEFEFVDKIVGGAIPRQYIPSVEKGVRKAMIEGALAGYPLVDVRVILFDGSYHDVDSSDMAFQIAAGMALRKGVLEAAPVLLEPIMDVEVVVPDEYMGTINGDLNSRRGRVMGMEPAGKLEKIKAQVPLSEMLRYATDLRSMTQGRGSYHMNYSHYEEVPQRVAEKVIAQSQSGEKEE